MKKTSSIKTPKQLFEEPSLSINIQPKETSDNITLFLAYISTGKFRITYNHEIVDGVSIEDPSSGEQLWNPIFGDVEKKKFERIKVSTGISVPTAFYDRNKRICTKPYTNINNELKDFKVYCNQLYRSMVKSKIEITPELLSEKIKEYIVSKLKKSAKQSKSKAKIEKEEKIKVNIPTHFEKNSAKLNGYHTDLIDFIDDRLTTLRNQSFFVSKKTKSTVRSYTRILAQLKDYDENKKIRLDLLTISNKEIETFIDYLVQRGKLDGSGDYTHNSLTDLVKQLKLMIANAKGKKIPLNNLNLEDEDMKVFDLQWEKSNDPYLTFEQLDAIKKLRFDCKSGEDLRYNNECKYEKVRDAFILGCASACSLIDLQQIKALSYNKQEGWMVEYVRRKINKGRELNIKIKIPLADQWVVDKFKNKYQGEFDFSHIWSDFNESLSVICFKAGLKENFYKQTKSVRTGQPIHPKPFKLYEVITSKTMRKTFASNEVKEYGTRLLTVKRWTGHSSEAMVLNYVQLTEDEYDGLTSRGFEPRPKLLTY